MRAQALSGLAFSLVSILSCQSAAADEFEFLTQSAKIFGSQYTLGRLQLTLEGTNLQGRLEFADRSDSTVSGTALADGTWELVFGELSPERGSKAAVAASADYSLSGSLTVRYAVKSDDAELILDACAPDVYCEAPRFYALKHKRFSETARTISEKECGTSYGIVEISRMPGRRWESVASEVGNDPFLATLLVNDSIPFPTAVREDRTNENLPQFTIGESGFIEAVQRLRKLDSVLFADVSVGGCAFGDEDKFVVSRALIDSEGRPDAGKFQDFVRRASRAWLESHQYKFSMTAPLLRVTKYQPSNPVVTFTVVAASEVTRDVPGDWDRFRLGFAYQEMVANTEDDISILLAVENLSSIKRLAGNPDPPGLDQFTVNADRYDDEAIVIGSVLAGVQPFEGVLSCVHAPFGGLETMAGCGNN